MAKRTVGIADASAFLGLSKQTLHDRILNGKGPRIRARKPYRFSVVDLVTYARVAPPVRKYTRKTPSALTLIDDKLAKLLESTKGN